MSMSIAQLIRRGRLGVVLERLQPRTDRRRVGGTLYCSLPFQLVDGGSLEAEPDLWIEFVPEPISWSRPVEPFFEHGISAPMPVHPFLWIKKQTA